MNVVNPYKKVKTAGVFSALILCQACVPASNNTPITDHVNDDVAKQSTASQQLYFLQPAIVDIYAKAISPKGKSKNSQDDAKTRGKEFMGQALPLGNGRLGAMFAGGVESEYIVFNEISLWMNTVRGLNNVEQSGTPRDAHRHLDTVRQAVRERNFGKSADSAEALATKYLATKKPLGNYAPFADLKIQTGHDIQAASNYRRALDISTGLGSVTYDIAGVSYQREYFCSYPDDLCVIRLAADSGVMDVTLTAATVHTKKIIEAKGNELRLHGFSPMAAGDDMEFLQTAKVDAGKGEVIATADSLQIKGAAEIIIYVSGYTDYLPVYPEFIGRDVEADTAKTLKNAMAKGYQAIKSAHVADVSALMQRVKLDLDVVLSNLPTDQLASKADPLELQQLYFDYARYLHISSSRDAAIPSNLQGLWNTMATPPWSSDYHTDINVQMNYWLAETTNLSETFSPFVQWTKVLAESGQHTAKETFGVNKGWTIGLNSNVFGFTAQNVHGRRMQQGSHWLSQHLFEHYSFSKDLDYLADIYPVQKGACEFFVEHLAPWQDGSLLVYPTWSPENFFLRDEFGKFNKQGWGASYDQQLLVNLFTDCIEASVVLQRDGKFRQTLRDLIPRLTPQKINSHGMIQEWPEDLDDPENTHRHLSHLIGLHPGRDFSPLTTPKFSAASEKQLRVRIKRFGWAGAWRSSMWARLRNGDQALNFYNAVAFKMNYINLFNGKPWQIDGNLGAAAAVSEMLLQSHLRSIDAKAKRIEDAAFIAYREDPSAPNQFIAVIPPDSLADAAYILDLLPALPSKWSQGSVTGLKARGGFTVDMRWANGKLEAATIHASRDGKFRLYVNDSLSEQLFLNQGESFKWRAK